MSNSFDVRIFKHRCVSNPRNLRPFKGRSNNWASAPRLEKKLIAVIDPHGCHIFYFSSFPLFGGFTQQWRKFNRKEWKQKPWGIFPESLSLFPYDWCFLSFLDTHKNQIKGHLFAVPRHNEWIDKVCEATHKRPKHIWAKKIKVNSHPPKKWTARMTCRKFSQDLLMVKLIQ